MAYLNHLPGGIEIMDIPSLAIVAGALHTGLVRALEMPYQERVRQLLSSPFRTRYYNEKEFGRSFYVRYNSDHKWDRFTFKDPQLSTNT